MAVTTAVAAAVGAAVGVGGFAYSVVQGKKASKEAKKARKLEQMRNEAEERRRRRQEIRQARIVRAQTLNAGVQVGGQDSSALAGGIGSLQSQLAGSIGHANNIGNFNRAISTHTQRSANHSSNANIGSGLSNLGFQVFGAAGGVDGIRKGFE